MRVIYYQNRQVNVPETLEELTPAQYYRYLEIATMANQHILSESGIRLKLLSLFLALPVDMGHLPPSTWKETLALLSLTDPFVIREGKSFRLDLSTGINLLPEWNGFHGPEDMLNGVSFDTFCKCMALIRRMGDEGGGDRDMILREFGKVLYTAGREGAEPPILLCLHAYLFFMCLPSSGRSLWRLTVKRLTCGFFSDKMRSRKRMTIPAGRALGWISLRTGHSGTMQR